MNWMLMPYRRYAEFSGRSRRKEYWMFVLFTAILYSVIAVLMLAGGLARMMVSGDASQANPLFWIGAVLAGIIAIGSFLPSTAVIVRRLHDRNMSGWWYLGFILAGLIPIVGSLVSLALLVILALPGTSGPNRFGDDPKNPVGYDVFS